MRSRFAERQSPYKPPGSSVLLALTSCMQAVSAPKACPIGLSGSRRGFPDPNRQCGHDRSDRRPIFRRPFNSCNRASDDQDRTWPASKTVRPVARAKAAAVTADFRGALGVVLAGGLARRMGGGDKPLREIGGRTILARAIAPLEAPNECL